MAKQKKEVAAAASAAIKKSSKNILPGDEEALFHSAFISLGQEQFDYAQKYFERLAKKGHYYFSFDTLHG